MSHLAARHGHPSLPPYEVISSTDKIGLLIVITAITLSFVLISFCIRVYVRYFIAGPWNWDDSFVTAATFASCLQSTVLSLQMSKGFGKSAKLLNQEDLLQIGKAAYANDILFIFALFLSKCSIGFLFLRLVCRRIHSMASWASIAASAFWAVLSILLISISCGSAYPFTNLSEQCTNLFTQWQVICALDIVTEAAFFLLSIYLVAGMTMSLKLKATVGVVFSLRLPVIIASATRLHYVYLTIVSDDPTLQGAFASVCTQIELNYSILASSVSCLGPFLSPFTKNAHVYYVDTHDPHSAGSAKRSATDYNLQAANVLTRALHLPKPKVPVSRTSSITRKIKLPSTAVTAKATATNQQASPQEEPSRVGTIASLLTTSTTNSNNPTKSSRNEQRQSFETNDSQRIMIRENMARSVEQDGGGGADELKCSSASTSVGADGEGNGRNGSREEVGEVRDIENAVHERQSAFV